METGRLSRDVPRPRRTAQFSLASLLLVTFVVSVCLAVARVDIQFGIFLSFLTIPAIIRTAIVASRQAKQGRALNSRGWVVEFLFSWAITFPVTSVALLAAFAVALLLFLVDDFISVSGELFLGFIGFSVGAVVLVFFFGIPASLDYGPAKESEAFSRQFPRYLPALYLPRPPAILPPCSTRQP